MLKENGVFACMCETKCECITANAEKMCCACVHVWKMLLHHHQCREDAMCWCECTNTNECVTAHAGKVRCVWAHVPNKMHGA